MKIRTTADASLRLPSFLIFALVVFLARAPVARGGEADPIEVYTWGQQPTSTATEQTRWSNDLELRPSNTPSDVMRLVPGLTISQHHGGGKADQTVLSRIRAITTIIIFSATLPCSPMQDPPWTFSQPISRPTGTPPARFPHAR